MSVVYCFHATTGIYPMKQHVATIEPGDVGQPHVRREIPACSCCGRGPEVKVFHLPIDPIQPIDVGKRVYAVRDRANVTTIYQVENNEQRDRRLAGETT